MGVTGVQKPRYKARLVAHGFTQRVDYELEQLDVKTAFLHGNLEEVIYMRQPRDMNKVTSVAAEIGSTKSLLKKEFDMKELGEAKKILGMEIVRDRSRKILRVSQSGYVSKILNNFRIDNGKSVQMPLGGHFKLSLKDCPVRDCDVERMSKVPYANAVGSLMYLMVCTRPDIAYATTLRIRIKRRSIWLTEAVKEVIWLRGLLEELGVELNTVAVNCDNQGAIHLSRNHVFHERTKHINVRYHFIREVLEAKTVEVLKVGTEHNAADALTKVVPGLKLQHCLELLSVDVLADSVRCDSFFDEGLTTVQIRINVLDNSPLFDGLLNDTAHVVPYVVNGVGYEKGYYLADGIYPQWATFVKSFTVANDAKHAYFKKRQEGARKDVERAFGVLQGRWGIIQQPTRSYHVNTLRRVMYSCIILHNMILKDQKMAVFDWNEVYANPSRNMQRTWIERCETQRRKNKENARPR
ncbi:retrotransposon protein, putative, ty1-copia subclass [Tanacetum coccineum]